MTRLIAAALLLACAGSARAQIDDTRRTLFEGGFEDGLFSPGPSGAYAFLYLNRPGVAGPGSALRVALAPVYADVELGLPSVFGSGIDAGLGFSGGGYAFSRKEVVRGDQRIGESFIGHGGGPSLSLYRKLADLGPVPLNAVGRLSLVYTDYQNSAETDAAFVVPPDEWTGSARAGLRLGGQEPGIGGKPAFEVSTWYETRIRDRPGSYGYDRDRFVRREINLYWMRALLVMPPDLPVRASGGASVGGGDRLGRLAAYRLGGMLTQAAEFPLPIPGYFAQEIAAREFGHVWGRVGYPVSSRWVLNAFAAGAAVTPIAGTDPGGVLHSGFGAGIEFAPRDGALHGELSYGFAPRAVRGSGRGGSGIALTMEIDFTTDDENTRKNAKTRQEGLGWLLGH